MVHAEEYGEPVSYTAWSDGNFRFADKPLVIPVRKDGGVQIRVVCRKKDKRRRSGRPAQ